MRRELQEPSERMPRSSVLLTHLACASTASRACAGRRGRAEQMLLPVLCTQPKPKPPPHAVLKHTATLTDFWPSGQASRPTALM